MSRSQLTPERLAALPDAQPAQWYSTNLVGLPAPALASTAFQRFPRPLSIAGVRPSHTGLFRLLQEVTTEYEAAERFMHYMALVFGLHSPSNSRGGGPEQRRWRVSYSRLLLGWGQDANGPAGAVLKGWVESRFGLVPTFHKAELARFPSAAWVAYLEEKASSRWNNNSIWQQLDLLFEYAQWFQQRFHRPEGEAHHVTLWRGCSSLGQQVVAGSLRERCCTVRLNNLVSFSRSSERACCFGDWVMRVQVPRCKLLYFPGLLPIHALEGESEVIALGGDYQVEAHYATR